MSLPPKPTAPQGATAPGVTMPPRPTGRPAPAERRTLVVGKGISLQGTVTDAERLVVDGTVESQMIQAQELQITHSGVFKGEVQVDDAEIAGVFDGTLTARNSLTIRATGRVLGVARTRKLSVEEGGQLSGRMEMLTEGQASAPMGAPAAPQPAMAPQYAAPNLAPERY
ncbi:polymer-forming cytoskeletal protein [Roseomonas sp. SSH11]|uniref:Polymer-forming cytoskeletal protein n=2 Tax=Pararoseomonas baculiformis TaxID=2820812 RepID=A0ABS4AEE4_9PROT|nr:polymer-forming cytoskeletal protein [Pararoseomonas baculiformis]